MSELDIEVLKETVEKLPYEFIAESEDMTESTHLLSDDINIEIHFKKLILNKY